jgi:AraC-like DNA-binding protein
MPVDTTHRCSARGGSPSMPAIQRGELQVEEVSGAVGFADQSHFSNIFRKLTAMTPRGFRNSMSN